MFRKLFLIIAPVLFFVAIGIQLYCVVELLGRSPLTTVSAYLWIACIIWMLVMAGIYGSLYKTKWALILGGISFMLMVVGALMKLQHWTGSWLISVIGASSFGLVYLVHFVLKKKKKFIDVAKLLFVFSTLSFYLATIHRSVNDDFIAGVWVLLLVVLFIAVWLHIYRYKELTEQPLIAEDGDAIFNYENRTSSGMNQ